MSNTNEEIIINEWNKVKVVIKEYEVLRAEILQLMQNSSNTLNYGVTGLAAIWTAAAIIIGSTETSNESIMISILVSLIAPSLIGYSCRLWLLDTKSIIRIGKYIEWLEDKVEDLSGEKVLEWERCLHQGNKHKIYKIKKSINTSGFSIVNWKENYFKSFSFFRSHLFTVLYLYAITIGIAIFDLFFYKNNILEVRLKLLFTIFIIINTCFVGPPFYDLYKTFQNREK